jgi:hypothetical protein
MIDATKARSVKKLLVWLVVVQVLFRGVAVGKGGDRTAITVGLGKGHFALPTTHVAKSFKSVLIYSHHD